MGAAGFEMRIRELVDSMPDLIDFIEPLLEARRELRKEFTILHRKLLASGPE